MVSQILVKARSVVSRARDLGMGPFWLFIIDRCGSLRAVYDTTSVDIRGAGAGAHPVDTVGRSTRLNDRTGLTAQDLT
jgi:hypothetical protein